MEDEVILLRNVYDHIDKMVNYSLFEVQGNSPRCNIMFHDSNQKKLFFILLADFLSQTDRRCPIKKISFIRGLEEITNNPKFSIRSSEQELKKVVKAFGGWLEEKRDIDIWMPSIKREVRLYISRFDAIKWCGLVSKHNDLRAIGVVDDLQKIMSESGIEINREEALLALPDFYERFHNDILIYLSSHICEFLNDIRLAIRSYLQAEFTRSYYKPDNDSINYNYRVPETIQSPYARDCYRELMNNLRRKAYMQKFIISESFKCEY